MIIVSVLCQILIPWIGVKESLSQHNIRFSENKGQWNEQVMFRAAVPSGAVFFEQNSILFHFRDDDFLAQAHSNKKDFIAPESIKHHAFRAQFIGTSENPEWIGIDPAKDYENYFIGNDRRKWAGRVQIFDKLFCRDLFKGIDMVVHGKEHSLKYDFIVRPGSDPGGIVIEYEGLKSEYLKKGDLYLKTSLNEIVEFKPVAYQIFGTDSIPVKCKYKLRRNRLTFSFPDGYNKRLELIIDPHLVFSTYSGSRADNWGFTATFDSKGNVYSGGIVSNVGYPVTTGVFQDTFALGDALGDSLWDVGLIKYDSTGVQRLWASYLGGNGDEMPHSLVVDTADNLLVLGTTGSDNFPIDTSAFDTTFSPGGNLTYCNVIGFSQGVEMYITKISETGDNIMASTYMGGLGNDGINFRPIYNSNLLGGNGKLYYNYGDGARGEIIVDDSNYVYVGSCTFSDTFPLVNSFQPISGGKQDGVVFKMTSQLDSMIWGSYLGGRNDDAIYSIDVTEDGTVYVAGGTDSRNFPTTSNALSRRFNGGGADGFVAAIHPNGDSLISSTYFGSDTITMQNSVSGQDSSVHGNPTSFSIYSNIYDQVYFVRVDQEKNVFIAGQTDAPGYTHIYNAKYSTPNSGQFIAKLNTNLDSIVWSTAFGSGDGKPDISITAFAVGLNNRIMLSGWGRQWGNVSSSAFIGVKNMDITPTAYQSESDGMDFYVMVLTDDAACLEYATFLGELHYSACSNSGEDHVDGGTSRFDKRGYIYQAACASCDGCQKFPVLPNPGAWSTQNKSPNCNNAVFKFGFESPEFLPDLHRCNFDKAHLGDPALLTADDLKFKWTPSHLVSNDSIWNPTPVLDKNQTFKVEVTNGFCTTIYYQRFFQHYLELKIPHDESICDTKSSELSASFSGGLAHVSWSFYRNFSDTINTGGPTFTVSPDTTTIYYCRVMNDYCLVDDSVKITVHNVSINATDDFTICYGDTVELTAASEYSGQNIEYAWTPEEAIIEGHTTVNPLIYVDESTDFIVHAINTSLIDCEDMDTISVRLSPLSIETSELITESIDSIFKTQSIIIRTQTSTIYDFSWHSTEAFEKQGDPYITASPVCSGYYYLTVTDEFGCSRNDSVFIFVEDVFCNEDYVFVPNAFSPNNDSKNDILYVHSRMTNDIYFAVFDRWGEKVFETTNVMHGWDGSYKGQPMSNGVYVFYVRATCWDGSYFEKKGNVTLLR